MQSVFFSHPEGRGSTESVQGRVRRIQQLREALREVRVKMEAAAEQTDICQHVILIVIHTTGDEMRICVESTLIVFYYVLSLSRNIAKCWSRGENSEKTAGG